MTRSSTPTRPRARLAAAGLCAVLVAAPAVAQAQTVRTPDPADVGGASLNDVRRVVLDHRDHDVVVRVHVTDLRPVSEAGPASMAVFLDTRKGRRGAEHVVTTGLQDGTDFQLSRARDWRPVGEPSSCRHRVRLDYDADVVRVRVARSCLGFPGRVRVAVRMVDLFDGSHPVRDWMKRWHGVSRWAARG